MSRRSSTMTTLVIAFALALGAGIMVGMAAARHDPRASAPPFAPPGPVGPGWLPDQLKLTGPQREQMRDIWESAMQGSGKAASERRYMLKKQRDEAVLKLFTPEQKIQYDKLMQEYGAKLAEVDKARRALIQSAIERTKQILTPEQRNKYEEILSHPPHGGPREPGPHDGLSHERHPFDHPARGHWPPRGGGPSTRSAPRPATQPTAVPDLSAPANQL